MAIRSSPQIYSQSTNNETQIIHQKIIKTASETQVQFKVMQQIIVHPRIKPPSKHWREKFEHFELGKLKKVKT